jgi:5,10-methylenetetrahydromethanopterin reductase
MSNIKFDIIFAAECDLKTLTNIAKQAERYGFDTVWAGDNSYIRDYAVCLTYMAQATKRIGIGLAVTNPYLRHPFKSALAVASINEVSEGRAKFGIGAGSHETMKSFGYDWDRPAQRIADMITAVRPFLRGENVTFKTDTMMVDGVKACMPLLGPIPIYVGCRRPVMMRMAGRVADGVLLNNVPVEYLPYAISRLRNGTESAGRDLDAFDVGNLNVFSVSEDREEARERVRIQLPIDFISISERELESVGLGLGDVIQIRMALKRQFPEDFVKASRFVTDYMVEKFSVSGTPEDCVRRIKDYVKAGVTRILLGLSTNTVDKPEETIKLAGESILTEFIR